MKRKINRKPGWKQRQIEHEAYLKKLGVKGNSKGYRSELPDLSTGPRVTSDKVGNGHAREANKYTGDEIMGIVTTHKSNLMPVRRDNKQSAVDAAQMRRS